MGVIFNQRLHNGQSGGTESDKSLHRTQARPETEASSCRDATSLVFPDAQPKPSVLTFEETGSRIADKSSDGVHCQ